MYLNGNSNRKGAPNENYAREFMELFCLGPNGPDGTPNYVQADVAGLARAFTGMDRRTRRRRGRTTARSRSAPARFEPGAKTFLGQTIPALGRAAVAADGPAAVTHGRRRRARAPQPRAVPDPQAVGGVHREPDPAGDARRPGRAVHAATRLALRPVIRGILTHPLIFESLGEPNLVKPPVVYAVGLLRALGAPMKGNHMRVGAGQHAAAAVPAAERRGLGGRPGVAELQHGAGALRHRRAGPVPEVLADLLPRPDAARRSRRDAGRRRSRAPTRRPTRRGCRTAREPR